jgi:hypothetical protein
VDGRRRAGHVHDGAARVSMFGAFGRPYLELPTAARSAVLGALALLGTLLAAAIASRSPKVA